MNKAVSALIIFIGGAAAGYATGYFIAKKRLAEYYALAADEEIKSVKEKYKLLRKEGLETPEKVTEAITGVLAGDVRVREIIKEQSYDFVEDEPDSEPVRTTSDAEDNEAESRSIFDTRIVIDENGDPVEKDPFFLDRNEDEPFVISVHEFMYEEDNYEKVNLTYFEGDDTLCDERDQIVPDVEGTIGEKNLNRFGDHSDGEDTVFIRNRNLEIDFEVTREEGEFSVRILGLQSEMIPRPKKLKMRDDE